MPITDYELDAHLRQLAAPPPELDPSAARAAVLCSVRGAHRRRRRRGWTMAAVLLSASALVFPTAAIAERLFEAQTGSFGQSGMTEEFDGDEWIDLGTADLSDYVTSIAPRELPVPSGFDWNEAANDVSQMWAQSDAFTQRAGIIASYERLAREAWLDEWLVAEAANDITQRDRALEVLLASPNWPSTITSDGGGIRYIMWGLLGEMRSPDSRTRAYAAQALAEFEGYRSWDGIDRSSLVNDLHEKWFAAMGSPSVIDTRTEAYQRANAAALADVSGGLAE